MPVSESTSDSEGPFVKVYLQDGVLKFFLINMPFKVRTGETREGVSVELS